MIELKIIKYLTKEETSVKEETEIEKWIAQSEENKYYFELIKKIGEKKIFLEELQHVDVPKKWDEFKHRMKPKRIQDSGIHTLPKKIFHLTRIAAAMLFFIASATIIYYLFVKQDSALQQVKAMDSNTEIMFSDGSLVFLKKGSFISYAEPFASIKREVNLTGEAFFSVKKNDANPFCVYLSNTSIKVLGTSFNIKEEKNGDVKVNVISGLVSFSEISNRKNTVQIGAGQKGVYTSINHKFEQNYYENENFLAWKTKNLFFFDQSLAAVFQDLENSFDVRIIVADPEILKNKYSSKCEGQNLEDILDELKILHDITYIKKDSIIYIR